MGVPALYRYLSRKYPKIVQPVVEEFPVEVPSEDGEVQKIPVDTSQPNPCGWENDALYLDMNAIVHPCTHPEGKPAPKTEDEMMIEVFKYTERVINMIRPRRVLFFAIDGVAPRAKMNQQRSRRFRSAQEAKTKQEEREAAIAEWEAMGKKVSDEFRNETAWDSNAITPGTPFMTLLAQSIRYWVAQNLNTNPAWAKLQVIVSDASVPGEGEHKIMEFIRRQRTQPSHDPNTRHVIYGLDADLIMLSLATHEPHFRVLREDVFGQEKKAGCHRCGQPGHHSKNCTGQPKPKEKDDVPPEKKPFIFLDVLILREYLQIELDIPGQPFAFDLERAIDDWVFLIFFVGNDFLPHLPSLEIREGAIDTLLQIWRHSLPTMGGYLTEHGKVNLGRAQIILDGLASREDDIFRKRREAEEKQDSKEKRRRIETDRAQTQQQNFAEATFVERPEPPTRPVEDSPGASGSSSLPPRPPWLPAHPAAAAAAATSAPTSQRPTPPKKQHHTGNDFLAMDNKDIVANRAALRMANMSAADRLKSEIDASFQNQATVTEKDPEESQPRGLKRTASEAGIPSSRKEAELEEQSVELPEEWDDEDEEGVGTAEISAGPAAPKPIRHLGGNMVEQDDTVKLWEPGYKERYYRQKFGVEPGDEEFRKEIVKKYVEGLCWVLLYYYQGCPAWHWYYPYHFSPFASDFRDMASLDIKFDLGSPAGAFEQLLSVFPPASAVHLPETFRDLMVDDDSIIKDFYPEEFSIDMNGKKMLWQGVALLPFIDRPRLVEASGPRYANLTEEQMQRNAAGQHVLFVGEDNPLHERLMAQLYTKQRKGEPVQVERFGFSGLAIPDPGCVPGSTYFSPIPSQDVPDIDSDRSISVEFLFPNQAIPHRSVLLPGVRFDRRVLTLHDKEVTRNRRDGVDPRNESNGFHSQRRFMGGDGPGVYNQNNRGPRGRSDHRWSGSNGYDARANGRNEVSMHGRYDGGYNGSTNSRGSYYDYPPPRQDHPPGNPVYNYGGYEQAPGHNWDGYYADNRWGDDSGNQHWHGGRNNQRYGHNYQRQFNQPSRPPPPRGRGHLPSHSQYGGHESRTYAPPYSDGYSNGTAYGQYYPPQQSNY